nr:hypothetical protein Iba_chr09cCG10880 [Ipomoea batatas]
MPGAQLNNPSLFADLAAEITSHLVLQNHPDFPIRVVQPAVIWQVVFGFGVVNPHNHGRKPIGMQAFPQRCNSAQDHSTPAGIFHHFSFPPFYPDLLRSCAIVVWGVGFIGSVLSRKDRDKVGKTGTKLN